MAQAIGRHVARAGGTGQADQHIITSAGVFAGEGQGMTPEAQEALRAMGIAAAPHWSRSLTREMLEEADVVYAMSPAHRARALELIPDAAGKVHVLDPSGREIPDPLGGPQAVYSETARRLDELIRRRFKELAE